MTDVGTSTRPRRSTRVPQRGPTLEVPALPQSKRKGRANPEVQLDHFLTHSKSKLTTMDITDILNYEHFLQLSPEAQEMLCAKLPPTAFQTFINSLESSHPAVTSQSQAKKGMEETLASSPAVLDPAFFTNPFFLSGAKTFQDHVFTDWLSSKSKESVAQYEGGIRDGSLHAEWKDEEWDREYPTSKRLRASSDNLDLTELVKRGLLLLNDVVVYRQYFPSVGCLVEKELLVHSINERSHAIDFLLGPGTGNKLPVDLLISDPSPPQPPILTMEAIMSSVELQEGILDVHGQISRADRAAIASAPSASTPINFWGDVKAVSADTRAAKALSIWRWRDEMKTDLEMQIALDRGGREMVGTVYYLRRA